jgi:hypothetical protein
MAQDNGGTEARTRKMQQKLLVLLAESGNVSYSCKRISLSRETYYKWKEDPQFASDAEAAVDYGKDFVNDLAHNQLIRNIQEGNMQAVRFQLSSCHPDYQPKKPRNPDAQKFVPITKIIIAPPTSRQVLESGMVPIRAINIVPAQTERVSEEEAGSVTYQPSLE